MPMKSFIKFIIFSLILSIIISFIFLKCITKSEFNQLFGYSCLKVLTGSMYPEIKAGESIIIKKCKKYKTGDIITYITKDSEIVTHRIVSEEDGLYYTKGDANNVEDSEPILFSQIYGKVIFHFNSFFPNSLFSFAKHVDSNKSSVNVKIAKPIFIVDGDKEILIEKYGSVNDYNFSVRNYNENNQTSEVSLNYRIEIIAEDTVKYKLFCNNNLVDINNTFTLSHIIPKEDKYVLRIEAPEDYQGSVKINVYAYQMKEGKN